MAAHGGWGRETRDSGLGALFQPVHSTAFEADWRWRWRCVHAGLTLAAAAAACRATGVQKLESS